MFKLNSADILQGRLTLTSETINDVAFTYNADGTFTVSGIASATTVKVLLPGTAIPSDIVPGQSYPVKYKTTNTDVQMRIIFRDSNNTELKQYLFSEDTIVTVPANTAKWTVGFVVVNGKVISPTATVSEYKVLTAKTNKDLETEAFQLFKPTGATFSIWDDMPDASYYNGSKSAFIGSISGDVSLDSGNTYQVIKILNRVYITSAFDGVYYIGQKTTLGTQHWEKIATESAWFNSEGLLANNSDFNNIKKQGYYVIVGDRTYSHNPLQSGQAGILVVFPATANTVGQIVFGNFLTKSFFFRHSVIGSFTDVVWREASSGTNVTYEITEYENTYNVTASPSITTDTNQYLQSTGDTTNVTASIATMLTQYGVCRLGPGDFYVKDLEMPVGTKITGCGKASRLIMSGSGDGCAIKLNSYCSVSNVYICGDTSGITPSETLGARHGLLWQGTFYPGENYSAQPIRAMVSDVFISGFTGGGVTLYNTGLGNYNNLIVCNSYIWNCGAGINVAYCSEFNRFTNVHCTANYYGVINNGGNNMFVNCEFTYNKLGCLMDNANGQSPNNTHGSMVGCTFNHINNNTGIGIKILNCHSGFMFTGCQIFFGQIYLKDTEGIVISSTNFGKNNTNITIDGGGAVIFANNIHQGQPESGTWIDITDNTDVHFVNCYTRAGAVVQTS